MKKTDKDRFQITQEELDKQRDKITENPGTLTYPHHAGSAMVKPEDKGKMKGRAVTAMHEQTTSQLDQIYQQVQLLLTQAKDIKARIEVSERIYLASMGFEPIIGKIYYLYQKDNLQDVLSMVSPAEWGDKMPFNAYVAKVRLLADHTWEVLEKAQDL